MNKKTNLKLPSADSNKKQGFLTLPFNDNQFKDFIVNLLGVRQKLDRRIYGQFIINLDDIVNIHHLIQQRVEQQNNGKLLQLQSQIYYTDDSSITLNSLIELETYNEVRALTSYCIRLTWNFLIQFPDKDVPEQQIITIVFNTKRNRYLEVSNSLLSMQGIHINTEYTARSWGYDIDLMLQKHLESLIIGRPSYERFGYRNSEIISNLLGLLYLVIALIGAIYNVYFLSKEENEIIQAKISNLNTISDKIDTIMSYIVSMEGTVYIIYMVIFLFISFLIALFSKVVVEDLLLKPHPSFLLLTKKAEEAAMRYKKKAARYNFNIVLSFFISIITGLISNYIFSCFFQ